uniref:Aldose 1-epimerase n=1 Tax=Cryptomeria japonica TaxID=3369 RepID=A0A1V1G390_CRYJA|nr:aldose 1-epimerase [Cryptomeria japonica]
MGKLYQNIWIVGCIALLASLNAVQVCSESPKVFTLEKGDLRLKLTNLGATVLSVVVPDAKGNLGDIVLGFDSLDSYKNGTLDPYFGALVGRVANRIKDAQFTLNGTVYHLPANDGNNTLHGGKIGFDKVLWKVAKIRGGAQPSIQFTYHSYDGEQGFPGDLDVSVTYTITGNKELAVVMNAKPLNKATPVCLAQHTYWNLAGHNSGRTILDNKVKIWAHSYTPVDEHLLPTGAIVPVQGTPYDFNRETTVGSRIKNVPGGYDINMVLDPPKKKNHLRHAVRVNDNFSGRILNIWTDAPGLQFYSSNMLKKTVGKGGAIYGQYSALALETQTFPDGVHHSNFPNTVYYPGQTYRHTMVYRFSVQK